MKIMNSPNDQLKKHALEKISTLMRDHDISLDEIGALAVEDTLKSKENTWLVQLMGYIGGAFIFGGLCLLVCMIWNDLNSSARVIITYGPGLVAFVLGILTLDDARFQKASTPLFLQAAVLLPTGMFAFLAEYASGNDVQFASMVVFGLLAFQFLGAFAKYRRTSLLFFGFLFWNASIGILMDRVNISGDILGIALGLSIIMITWEIDKTPHRAIAAFWYVIGSLGFLWSVFDFVEGSPFDLLYLPFTILMMFMSVRIKSRSLLLVSTFALLGYLGYFTGQYFAHTVGWPVALIVMGFVLIGISAYAVRLSKTIKHKQESAH